MPSRRSLYTALLCLLPGPWMAAQAPAARIRIDTSRVIGEVNPHIFGNFAEHLGRCIYGGIFEEGSPLSDADGYRKDVLEAVKPLGVSILRWPGGNFASGYNWTDGIGPRDQRPARPDHAWGALETNRFGTDEFLHFCRLIGAEPQIALNLGTGTADEAAAWVRYVNEHWNKGRGGQLYKILPREIFKPVTRVIRRYFPLLSRPRTASWMSAGIRTSLPLVEPAIFSSMAMYFSPSK